MVKTKKQLAFFGLLLIFDYDVGYSDPTSIYCWIIGHAILNLS